MVSTSRGYWGNNQLPEISWGELAITTFILNFLSSVMDERQVCGKNVFFEDEKKDKKIKRLFFFLHKTGFKCIMLKELM